MSERKPVVRTFQQYGCLFGLATVLAGCGGGDDAQPDAGVDASIDAGGDAQRSDGGSDGAIADAAPDRAIDAQQQVCGDGILVVPNEQCDLGSSNGPGAPCSSTCTVQTFRIDTSTTGNQATPEPDLVRGFDVTATASGWAVVWTATGPTVSDTDVRSRLFELDGRPRTNGITGTSSDYLLHQRAGAQFSPRIAARARSDDFAVAWTERNGAQITGRIRRYGGDGTPAPAGVDEQDIGGAATGTLVTSLATLPDGNHVVVWYESENSGYFARRYEPAGLAAQGAPALLATASMVGGGRATLAPLGANQNGGVLGLVDNAMAPNGRGIDNNLALTIPFWNGSGDWLSVAVHPTNHRSVWLDDAGGTNPTLKAHNAAGTPFANRSLGDATTETPHIASSADGFLAVWAHLPTGSQMGSIQLVRLDQAASVIPVFPGGPNLETVSSLIGHDATQPQRLAYMPMVDVHSDGSVLVVWRDKAQSGSSGTYGLFGKLFPKLLAP